MRRTGLRLRAARGHPEVQAVVRPFVRWLRERYEFPVRVPVYLSPVPQFRTVHVTGAQLLLRAVGSKSGTLHPIGNRRVSDPETAVGPQPRRRVALDLACP